MKDYTSTISTLTLVFKTHESSFISTIYSVFIYFIYFNQMFHLFSIRNFYPLDYLIIITIWSPSFMINNYYGFGWIHLPHRVDNQL